MEHTQLDLIFNRPEKSEPEQSPRKPVASQPRSARQDNQKNKTDLKEYRGAIHIHSRHSDGSGEIEKIAAEAGKSKLDFIIISDHILYNDSSAFLLKKQEGWYDDLLVLIEQEISPRRNHYLVLGLNEAIVPGKNDYWKHIDEVHKKGGLGFAAHPFRDGVSTGHIRYRTWINLDDRRIDGFELWSYMIDWASQLNRFHFREILRCIKNPAAVIKGPSFKALSTWDWLTRTRRMPAIGSIDAHAKKYFFGLINIFPYRFLFNTIRTYIQAAPFEGKFENDKLSIYEALKEGRCFISYDYLQPASGFDFKCVLAESTWCMGEEFSFRPGMRLEITLPGKAGLRLIKDGSVAHASSSDKLTYPLENPGVYRVEVFLGEKPWIYSNPIYIRKNANV